MNFFTVSRNFRDEVQTTPEGLVRAELFFPVKKFDVRTGKFEGWSTVEEVDNHREICDVEKSWPALVDWSNDSMELSDGKSVGNLRIMHDRNSNGGHLTLMERQDRDGLPAVYIEGIADDSAKSKTAVGDYTGISIRGLTRKWPDPVNPGVTRYAFVTVEEKSLCDRPAVPHALIEVTKSDGGIEMVQAIGRTIAQFWDCGVAGCIIRHQLKGEAIKCEGVPGEVVTAGGTAIPGSVMLPRRIEARATSAEVKKSLWDASDLIACLAMFLNITDNVQFDESWEAMFDGDKSGLPIIAQMKECARSMFAVLQALIADESAEFEEDMTEDTAMSFAMRALAKSETAKQLIKSLRVQTGDGSNGSSNSTSKEKDMDDKQIAQLVSSSVAEAIKQYDAARKEEAANVVRIAESAKAADAATDARIRLQLAPLVIALGGDVNATDTVAEVAKAYGAQVAAAKTLTEGLTEVEKHLGLLFETVELVQGVKSAPGASIEERAKAIKNKPAKAPGNQREVPVPLSMVSKSDDSRPAGEPAPAHVPADFSKSEVIHTF